MKIINSHCHLITFRFIPNSFFKTRHFLLQEWMLNNGITRGISNILTKLIPGKKYNLFHQQLKIMKKNIYDQTKAYIQEMEEADEIVMATPLMMDLEIASSKEKPEISYLSQINIISDIGLQYPGKIMPFVMIDPRREDAAELTIKSFEEYGFLGLKMYPPLGYHPDPTSICNKSKVNDELSKIYSYCNEHFIPITTHCSKGGAYSSELISAEEARQLYTNPSSWKYVVDKYKNLKLNFAHFGGDLLEIDKSKSWSSIIVQMIHDFPNVYTDLSYHDDGLQKKTKKKYFDTINTLIENDEILRNRVLFGTDWLMTRHTWKEKDYVKNFKSNLSFFDEVAFTNPINFLFHENTFPKRIMDFYKRNGKEINDLPSWLTTTMKNL